ncbi:helix-turn-helix domain-containing protein [Streptomyces sp. NPDC020379]|uniref:helix-turn-helix domain-containing protein n=1 Tax=Streptomyces sp. NPDC020379 TaxID=3365071 RepID=UPI0037AAC8CD
MPKLVSACPAGDVAEEVKVRRLAGARHASADWILRARTIVLSREGDRVPVIASRLGCHHKTVRKWLHRFSAQGLDGLGDRPGCGRKRRITEAARSRIVALVGCDLPGRLVREPWGDLAAEDESAPGEWALDTLAEAARCPGIDIQRSQVRRIFLAEGVCWRCTRSWITSRLPRRTRIVGLYTNPSPDARVICAGGLGPVIPRTFPPVPGWSPDGHRIKAGLDYARGPEKTWIHGALRTADGNEITMAVSSRNSKATREWSEGPRGSPTPSSPAVCAGGTSRRAGGASSAKRPGQDSPSPTPTRPTTPPESQPPSSTPVLNPESGAAPRHQHAHSDAVLSTAFEESG